MTISFDAWFDIDREKIPHVESIKKDALRALANAEGYLDEDAEDFTAVSKALGNVEQEINELTDAAIQMEKVIESYESEVNDLQDIIKKLASWMPLIYLEVDEAKGDELVAWARLSLSGDWEACWLSGPAGRHRRKQHLMLVIMEPSDQTLFQLRWG